MIIKTADELHQLVKNALLAAGADEPNAEDVAEHLILANLSGVDTHGIWHLPRYVESSKSGEIVATAHPEVLNETAHKRPSNRELDFRASRCQICDRSRHNKGKRERHRCGWACSSRPYRETGPLCRDGSV